MRAMTWMTCLLLLGGCRTVGLPDDVAKYGPEVAPGGKIEIEVAADGSILEMEYEVGSDWIPEPAHRAAAAAVAGCPGCKGGAPFNWELEWMGGGWSYEVKFRSGDHEHEVIVDAVGRVLLQEVTVAEKDVPAAVLSAAREAVPGGKVTSRERITGPGRDEFHVKVEKDGIHYKMLISPAGVVTRKAREVRAEIEVPVR